MGIKEDQPRVQHGQESTIFRPNKVPVTKDALQIHHQHPRLKGDNLNSPNLLRARETHEGRDTGYPHACVCCVVQKGRVHVNEET